MKTAALLLVLAAVVAVAAGLSPAFKSLMLGGAGAGANVPPEVQAELDKIKPKLIACMMPKMSSITIDSKISDLLAIVVECINNEKDNSACCMKAGLVDKCAKQLCNGTPPVKWTLSQADLMGGGCGGNSKNPGDPLKCFVDAQQ